MGKRLTAAGRRAIASADPATGLLQGRKDTLDSLTAQGLAVRHPRPPHRHYLTPAGREVREQITAPPPAPPATAPAPAAPGTFAARTGDEAEPADGAARERQVRSAWEGLRELRRITGRDGTSELPCAWERTHPLSAVGLALEAAGCRPSALDGSGGRGVSGYRVTTAQQPDAVCVTWVEADGRAEGGTARSAGGRPAREELSSCAAALERAGWQLTEHAAPGTGGRFLLISPRRA